MYHKQYILIFTKHVLDKLANRLHKWLASQLKTQVGIFNQLDVI